MKPYFVDERAGITIYHGDCREVLPSIDRADAVIADPPYGETALEWDSQLRNVFCGLGLFLQTAYGVLGHSDSFWLQRRNSRHGSSGRRLSGKSRTGAASVVTDSTASMR